MSRHDVAPPSLSRHMILWVTPGLGATVVALMKLRLADTDQARDSWMQWSLFALATTLLIAVLVTIVHTVNEQKRASDDREATYRRTISAMGHRLDRVERDTAYVLAVRQLRIPAHPPVPNRGNVLPLHRVVGRDD